MDKRRIVQDIQAGLAEELRLLENSARAAHEAATHEESRQEDSHDTRSIEASYLAGAQAKRAAEIKRLITLFRFFPLREFEADAVACAGALVELSFNGTHAFYFLVPQGGGFSTKVEGKPVQVITPESPMGEALLGRRVGDTVEVETRSGDRSYEIVSIR